MCRRLFDISAIVFIIPLAIAPTGCGSNGLASVTGSVTYQGKPATGATVHFHREGETAEEAANYPMGLVDEDGNFYLEVTGVGYGAAPGKYKVLVRWAADAAEKEAASEAQSAAGAGKKTKKARQPAVSRSELRRNPKSDSDRLKFRYFNLDKPLLSAEIKPGSNKLDPFELKD